ASALSITQQLHVPVGMAGARSVPTTPKTSWNGDAALFRQSLDALILFRFTLSALRCEASALAGRLGKVHEPDLVLTTLCSRLSSWFASMQGRTLPGLKAVDESTLAARTTESLSVAPVR